MKNQYVLITCCNLFIPQVKEWGWSQLSEWKRKNRYCIVNCSMTATQITLNFDHISPLFHKIIMYSGLLCKSFETIMKYNSFAKSKQSHTQFFVYFAISEFYMCSPFIQTIVWLLLHSFDCSMKNAFYQ